MQKIVTQDIESIVAPWREEYENDRENSDIEYNIDYFTFRYDYDFLEAVYSVILGRKQDNDGMLRNLELLNSSKREKIDILCDLRYSAEGEAKAVIVKGLKKRRLISKITKFSFFAKIMRWYDGVRIFSSKHKAIFWIEQYDYQAHLRQTKHSGNLLLSLLSGKSSSNFTVWRSDLQKRSSKPTLHQVIYKYSTDSITLQAEEIRLALLDAGFQSDILTQFYTFDTPKYVKELQPHQVYQNDGLLLHYTIGCQYMERISKLEGKKILFFHGVTPSDYFEYYDSIYTQLLEQSRDQIEKYKDAFDLVYTNAKFHKVTLENLGFDGVTILPLFLGSAKQSSENIGASSGSKILLFCGDIVPQNEILDLIELFVWIKKIEPATILRIIGQTHLCYSYYQEVVGKIFFYELGESIEILQNSRQDTSALFTTVSLYLSNATYVDNLYGFYYALHYGIPIVARQIALLDELYPECYTPLISTEDKLLSAGHIVQMMQDSHTSQTFNNAQQCDHEKQLEYTQFIQRIRNA